ncbi:Shikimate 5-dehydrogenase I alpha [hydrothermal vent metagenome]|uniref:shikimate dehydrogenase (NADP(+)) n=1 Tax=hydrothermal vent metagenome TaxID=652676 RepID=A0A3B0ZX68_9ZZZZ
MSSLFDFDARPDAYAVMGNPISHSKSPLIHAAFAQQTQQRLDYSAIQVDAGGFEQAVGNFRASGGKGLNITVPFKQEAWEFVDERSERAVQAGAVNTISFNDDGSCMGDNTDGVGLVRDLIENHSIELAGKRILILGAGGAVRGVLGPMLAQQPSEIVIANRTEEKAIALANEFNRGDQLRGCGFPSIDDQPFDIIINGTAASLQGDLPPVPATAISNNTCCYDMMYGKEPTVFMAWASEHRALKVLDGLGMLVEQAAESFFIWRGVRPDTREVIASVKAAL